MSGPYQYVPEPAPPRIENTSTQERDEDNGGLRRRHGSRRSRSRRRRNALDSREEESYGVRFEDGRPLSNISEVTTPSTPFVPPLPESPNDGTSSHAAGVPLTPISHASPSHFPTIYYGTPEGLHEFPPGTVYVPGQGYMLPAPPMNTPDDRRVPGTTTPAHVTNSLPSFVPATPAMSPGMLPGGYLSPAQGYGSLPGSGMPPFIAPTPGQMPMYGLPMYASPLPLPTHLYDANSNLNPKCARRRSKSTAQAPTSPVPQPTLLNSDNEDSDNDSTTAVVALRYKTVDPFKIEMRPPSKSARTHTVPPPMPLPYYAMHGQTPVIIQPAAVPVPEPQPSKQSEVLRWSSHLFFDTIPRQVYLHFLLRIPGVYNKRVTRVLNDAKLSMPDVERMMIKRVESISSQDSASLNVNWPSSYQSHLQPPRRGAPSPGSTHGMTPQAGPASLTKYRSSEYPNPDMPKAPIYLFRDSWNEFISVLISEWQASNIVSALLLPALLTLLQIESVNNNIISRTLALLSVVCSLMSLIFGTIYMTRFGIMRQMHKAASWAVQAQRPQPILWNVWIFLSMPAIWFSWSILLFVACILSYIWQPSPPPDLVPPNTLAMRVLISAILGTGLVYFMLAMNTVRKFGSGMNKAAYEHWQAQKAAAMGTVTPAYAGVPPVVAPGMYPGALPETRPVGSWGQCQPPSFAPNGAPMPMPPPAWNSPFYYSAPQMPPPQPATPAQTQTQPAPTGGAGGMAQTHASGAPITRVIALDSYEANESIELDFEKGDVITVVDRGHYDWWRGQLRGRTGIFSVNYVEPLPESTPYSTPPMVPPQRTQTPPGPNQRRGSHGPGSGYTPRPRPGPMPDSSHPNTPGDDSRTLIPDSSSSDSDEERGPHVPPQIYAYPGPPPMSRDEWRRYQQFDGRDGEHHDAGPSRERDTSRKKKGKQRQRDPYAGEPSRGRDSSSREDEDRRRRREYAYAGAGPGASHEQPVRHSGRVTPTSPYSYGYGWNQNLNENRPKERDPSPPRSRRRSSPPQYPRPPSPGDYNGYPNEKTREDRHPSIQRPTTYFRPRSPLPYDKSPYGQRREDSPPRSRWPYSSDRLHDYRRPPSPSIIISTQPRPVPPFIQMRRDRERASASPRSSRHSFPMPSPVIVNPPSRGDSNSSGLSRRSSRPHTPPMPMPNPSSLPEGDYNAVVESRMEELSRKIDRVYPRIGLSLATWDRENAVDRGMVEERIEELHRKIDRVYPLIGLPLIQEGDGRVQEDNDSPGGQHHSVRVIEWRDHVSDVIETNEDDEVPVIPPPLPSPELDAHARYAAANGSLLFADPLPSENILESSTTHTEGVPRDTTTADSNMDGAPAGDIPDFQRAVDETTLSIGDEHAASLPPATFVSWELIT